jgi:predicted nucleic acid-binding Zn ribbon protein
VTEPDPPEEQDEPTNIDEPNPLDLARDITDRYKRGGAPAPQGRRRRPTSSQPSAGPRSKRDDAVPISEVFGELIRDRGWGKQLDAQRVLEDWGSIVGPEVAQHSRVTGFADAVVHVETRTTAWATQLKLLAPRIVARLNELLGDGSVLRIEIRGPQAPSWKSGPRSIRGQRGPRDTYG